MIFERIKSEGLAHNSYFVGAGGSAAVIDPRRDIEVYLELALKNGFEIKYVLETHRNEDYVIGSLELAQAAKAEIYHGGGLDWKYGKTLEAGQRFHLGNVDISAVSTPGHTEESTSFILVDRSTGDTPIFVFSGDSLFIGDSGRIDLSGPGESERLAGLLWDSIHHSLLPLGDGVILCPAHGAGSLCGISIADRDESTLGTERLQNPILQIRDRREFVEKKLAERPDKPPYFARMEQLNLAGPPVLGCLKMPPALSSQAFSEEIDKGAVVLDTRPPVPFGGAHIKGSYNIWLDGLPGYAGWLLPYDKPIVLVLEDRKQIEKAARYLVRMGYDNIAGYLNDIEMWYEEARPIEKLPLLSVFDLKEKMDRKEDIVVLDVRRPDEWHRGHIRGSLNIFVGELEGRLDEIPRDKKIIVHCTVGRRSSVASSILLREGFLQVYNVLGSFMAWRTAGFPVVREGRG